MDLVLDLLQGIGLAAACGIRPFLPAAIAGGLAAADLGIDFNGTDFAFAESPGFIVAAVALFVGAVILRHVLASGPGDAAVQGLAIGLGAVLCAATLDDRHDTWWYGLLVGAIVATVAAAVSRDLFGRVRERFARAGDTAAASALPIYAEAAAAITAGLSVLLPPLGAVALVFLAVLGVRQRGRSDQKYAGLRVLR